MRDPITAVIFDVNETLSDLNPIAERFAAADLPAGAQSTWFAALLRDGFALTALRQEVRFRELATTAVAEIVAQAGSTADVPALTASVLAGFDEARLHPDVQPGVLLLRARGLRLATLSNGAVSVAERLLGAAGIREHFDQVLSVEAVGAWKPLPEPYRYALSQLQVSPEAALMVAVHPWDLHGAKAAGLRTAWLNRNAGHYPAMFTAPDLIATGLEDLARQLAA